MGEGKSKVERGEGDKLVKLDRQLRFLTPNQIEMIDEMLDRVLENSAYLIRYFKGQVTREKQEATEPDSPKLDSDADWE